MKDLAYAMLRVTAKHRDGSYGTQATRRRVLTQAAKQLESMGYKHMKSAAQLKPKHIWSLLQHWRESGVSNATIKNRMSHLRWLSEKTNNPVLVAKSNEHYKIGQREYISNKDKSVVFKAEQITSIRDPHVRLSAELQKEFGLRREEAMKFIPARADKGDRIELQGSWTKGGKPRAVPITTDAQRAVLDRCRAFVGHGSMIPSHKTYIQQVKSFEKEMHRVGLGRSHGARHLYAQNRYRILTGWEPPATGGPSRQSLRGSEKELDESARLQVSRELGHERIQIVGIYLGT